MAENEQEYKIKNLIWEFNLDFSYNADLGTLQQHTKDNIKMLHILRRKEIITAEEHEILHNFCYDYFKKAVAKVLEQPYFYLN